MNKKLFFILLLLTFYNTMLSQQQPVLKDSNEVYQYWSHRGIVEIIAAYMNDYEVAVSPTEKEKIGIENYEKKFITNIDNQQLPSFEIISSFLMKNGWVGAEKTILQPLIKNIVDTIALNQKFFNNTKRNISKENGVPILVPIDYIPKGNNDINSRKFWKRTAQVIVRNYETGLENILKEDSKIEQVKSPNNTSVTQENYNSSNDVKESSSDWIDKLKYLLLFLIGVFVGGGVVYFISRQKIYSILNLEKDEYLHRLNFDENWFLFKYLGLIQILKTSKDSYKNDKENLEKIQNTNLISLNEKIKTLEIEKRVLKEKEQRRNDEKYQESNSQLENNNNEREWIIQNKEEKVKSLFFTMPESDGKFILSNGDVSNDGRKFYKIEYMESSLQGQLFFISGDRDKRAINHLESYLKPVCDIENLINAESAIRIDFISSGKVNLINDGWVIDSNKKVKIKLL